MNQRREQSLTNRIISIFAFAVMLMPFSLSSTSGDISANYTYAIIIPILAGYLFKRNHDAFLYFIYIIFSGVIGVFVNKFAFNASVDLLARQYISIVVAALPVIIMFCNLEKYYESFKVSVILCGGVYSMFVLYNFIGIASSVGIDTLSMKALIAEKVTDWPQRYILILFAGFFFTFDNDKCHSNFYLFARGLILSTILVSFLRAAYLALTFGMILFYISKFSRKKYSASSTPKVYKYQFYDILKGVIFLIIIGTIFVNIEIFEPIFTVFEYLYNSSSDLASGGGDLNTSDATRLDIFSAIITALSISPLTGLGGSGVYLIAPEFGSSHNQYFDYLIRFGIIGLSFFLYFNIRILKYFWTKEPGVVGLLISFALFGIAHETTKYSYGGLIFFFLLSLTYSKHHINNNVITSYEKNDKSKVT